MREIAGVALPNSHSVELSQSPSHRAAYRLDLDVEKETRMKTPTGYPDRNTADTTALDEVMQCQLQWVEHVVDLQTTWLTSYWAMQAEFWRQWMAGPAQLPAWMVWHNGTEQLA
jgi:hypothetical protein